MLSYSQISEKINEKEREREREREREKERLTLRLRQTELGRLKQVDGALWARRIKNTD